MPKSRGNSKSQSRNSNDWGKFDFVEINLSEEDKADFKKLYAEHPSNLLNSLDEMTKNGYKVSLTYDTSNNCVIASLTCKEPLDANFNYILSARSSDTYEALALVLYKHYYLSDDGDWGAETRTNARSWG